MIGLRPCVPTLTHVCAHASFNNQNNNKSNMHPWKWPTEQCVTPSYENSHFESQMCVCVRVFVVCAHRKMTHHVVFCIEVFDKTGRPIAYISNNMRSSQSANHYYYVGNKKESVLFVFLRARARTHTFLPLFSHFVFHLVLSPTLAQPASYLCLLLLLLCECICVLVHW